jgi:hypothetical protein
MSGHVAISVVDKPLKQSRQPFYASNFRANHTMRQVRGLLVALVVAGYFFFHWEFFKSYVFSASAHVPSS